MSNISFNDFLDRFDLPAFTNAGGDWELLKSILKNAATADTSSSSSSTPSSTNTKIRTNTNKSESKPAYASININTGEINKSEPKKKSSPYTNQGPSTLSGSSDETKYATKHGEPLFTVTIDKGGEITFSDKNDTSTYMYPMDKVKISKEEEENDKVKTGFSSRNISSIGTASNSNTLDLDSDVKPISYKVYSNEGIRTFLYGMRKRLPHTVDFIENVMGDEGNYHDFIYKELSDEVLDNLIEGLDKEMKKYSSFLDCFKDQDN